LCFNTSRFLRSLAETLGQASVVKKPETLAAIRRLLIHRAECVYIFTLILSNSQFVIFKSFVMCSNEITYFVLQALIQGNNVKTALTLV